MRLNSALLAVVFGLVGTACAAPMDAAVANSLDARGLPLFPDGTPFALPITYKRARIPSTRNPPKAEIEKTVMVLLEAAAEHFVDLKHAKETKRGIELQPTNGWRAKANNVEFQFKLTECGGMPCQAEVTMDGPELKQGKITSGDGHVLFTSG